MLVRGSVHGLVVILAFTICAVSFNLLNAGQASALWKDKVDAEYKVYTKNSTVISNKSISPYYPVWVRDIFIPQIVTRGVGCDDNKVATRDFDSSVKFWNCSGLKIEESTDSAANNAWFQDANISYVISDFDNAETIDIGRGRIIDWGKSVSSIASDRQSATAKKNTGPGDNPNCDSTNPNESENCSLLIYFTKNDPGDFHITLDNVYNSGKPSSGHEYWYDGPVVYPYYTLTFDLNGAGASVEDNPSGDGVRLVSRKSNGNLLRDYPTHPTGISSNYPVPTRDGYQFVGWFDDPNGGKQRSSYSISKDNISLYAHWKSVSGGYVLVPHVETPSDAVKQGDTVTFTPGVTKDNNTNSNTTSWKFCRLIVAPNETVPAAGSVCSSAKATVVESNNTYVFNGAGPFTIGNPANHAYTVPANTPYGAQICYALLVDSSTQEPSHPAEAVKCVTVAKYPSVHILGGDVKVGDSTFAALVNQNASIQTGSFNVGGRSYGSWAEYGLFAPANGKIISSSGGMLSGANGADAATVNSVSQNGLTFANVTTYGYWAPAGLLTMPTAIASAASANSGVATTQVDVGTNVSAASGEVRAWNITAPGGTVNVRGTLPAGSGSVILLYNGTVNINGDIRLGDSTVRSLGNNSQIIIVARNITIDPSVSNVDAWLIATPSTSVSNDGRISTCGAIQTDAYYTGLTLGGECDTTPLRITGTVVARELQLRRSFAGSGAGSNAMAAETINLRPDAYMWGNTNGGSVNIETSFVKELPPRL